MMLTLTPIIANGMTHARTCCRIARANSIFHTGRLIVLLKI